MEKKSNKGLIALIILLTILVLGLGTYVAYDKFLRPSETKPATKEDTDKKDKTDTSVSKKDSTKPIVYDENTSQYEKVPIINIDSVDADRLNKKIKDFAGTRDTYDENFTINYDFYENSDVLSIIVKSTTPGSSVYYVAANINTKTGKEVTNKALIEIKNINESDFTSKVFGAYEKDLEDTGALDTAKSQKYYGGHSSVYEGTQNKIKNTKLDDFDMYLNSNGELCVVADVYLIAGPEHNEYIYNLDTNSRLK